MRITGHTDGFVSSDQSDSDDDTAGAPQPTKQQGDVVSDHKPALAQPSSPEVLRGNGPTQTRPSKGAEEGKQELL